VARILVVDDDEDIVRLVVRRLQHATHRVHGVHNAADAHAFVDEKGTPDIVVLDVDMPDVDGLQLLRELREQTASPELPAIFLSGRMRPDDIAAGRELGAVYLTKPFVANALIGAIDVILEAKQRRESPAQEW
jgi:DNA-binding response OmpR family regulator